MFRDRVIQKLEGWQLKPTEGKKSFIQRFGVRTSGCLRRAETANKLLSCEAPITACPPGFLTSGSHYSLTSGPLDFRSSDNQHLILALSRKGRGKCASPFTLHSSLKKHTASTLAEGATHVDTTDNVRRVAFTLAEVLITLGIIGVVAAMTMPVLIANHKKTVAETRLAKFYSTMNQAVQRAEVDYGDKTQWDKYEILYEQDEDGNSKPITNVEYFNKYFAPYIVATKIEDNEVGKTIVYFPDGSVASFGGYSIQFWPEGKDFKGYSRNEDTGKFQNDMENSGRKYFTFFFAPTNNTESNKYHYNKGVEPYMYNWDGTEDKLKNDNAIGCKQEVTNERAYCTALIQMNGWKIPKDYPLRF